MLDQVDNENLERMLAKNAEKRKSLANKEPEPEKEMSFLEHLEVLRWHLFRSVIAVLIITVIAFVSKGIVFGIQVLRFDIFLFNFFNT